MILKNLSVTSFRNIEQTDLSFGDGFNIFFGNNAQGKTNLLESIYLLGTMKSFRMARNSELIRWGMPYGILRGAVERDGVMREIALLIEKGGKKARIDRKSVVRISDFFGSLNVVVFSPDEMAMAKGQPENRRRYLDRAIFSGDADYLRIHHDYYRILKNRNILLKTGETDDLHAWDVQFAQTGARLMSDRIAYLDEIAPLLRHYYLAIAGGSEEAGIRYLPHPAEGVYTPEGLLDSLARSTAEERRRGITIVGPHRDDVEFLLNGVPLKRHASQGEQRSFILALKMAEISYLENKFGYPPILLLDDLTSELDRDRNRNLMEFLEQRSMQVFITTTSLQNIMLQSKTNFSAFHVEAGKVLRENLENNERST